MAKKLNFAEMGLALEAEYNNKLNKEKEKNGKEANEIKACKEEYQQGIGQVFAVNNKRKSLHEFKFEVRKSLLTEALFALYNKSFGNKLEYQNEEVIKRGLVSKFVNEYGAEEIINNMKGKSLLLSDWYNVIEEYTDLIIEANKETESNTIDQKVKDNFFEDIYGEELKDVSLSIKMRVAGAIEEFNLSNQEEKMDIENIIKISQDKIATAQTERLKEHFEMEANQKIFKVRQRKRNIFESMVYNMSKSYYSNETIKEQYSTDGKIDIDKIVESCELMYAFLETLNTAKVIEIDEEYLQKFVKDFK